MPLTRSLLVGFGTAAALAGVLLSSAGVLTAAAATSPTAPKALLAAATTAAGKQSAVHYVAISSVGTQSIKIVANAAASKGSETIVIHQGKVSGHIAARFVNNAVYFQADTTGLEGYLGMPSTLAPKYAGQWISFTSTDKDYSDVSQSMTIKAAVSQISVKAPITSGGSSTITGTAVLGVKGTTSSLSSKGNSGPATLYVAATGSPLPVRYAGQGKQKKKKEVGQVDFSNWGKSFSVAAPAKSISATSISTSSG